MKQKPVLWVEVRACALQRASQKQPPGGGGGGGGGGEGEGGGGGGGGGGGASALGRGGGGRPIKRVAISGSTDYPSRIRLGALILQEPKRKRYLEQIHLSVLGIVVKPVKPVARYVERVAWPYRTSEVGARRIAGGEVER